MGFLSPWFLGGLAAVAIPVYVHLLRQHKATPLPFSSLMFFERRTQSSVKHRRLKYLALFALRVATIALVALTFAGFYVSCSTSQAARGKVAVLAIDRSLSMQAGDRMESAKAEAQRVAGSLAGTAQVIAFDSQAAALTQQLADKAAVQNAIASIHAGDGRSAYGTVARAIASVANATPQTVEAHIFTDMQRTSLPSPFSELALPSNVRLVLHPVADKRDPNWYVETVAAPRAVYQPNKVRVQATVAGAGTEAAELNASVVLNGRAGESKRVSVPANGRATVEFFLSDVPHGFNRGEVRIDARDALAKDNAFPFAMERKETSRVLFIGGERAGMYYRTALESVPEAGFTVEQVAPDQAAHIGFEKYSVVVLSDPNSVPDSLSEYVKHGGGLMMALGAASVARDRVAVTGDRIEGSLYSSRAGERFQVVSSADASHAALAGTNGFEGVKFYQSVRLKPGDSRVLARLSDGAPLVTEKKVGDGRVLVFASTFDNIANDFPLHPSFVPFVEESARYLSGAEGGAADYSVGSFVELRSAKDTGVGTEVIGPNGERELSLAESVKLPSFQLPREGFFEIRRANGRNELVAAHADRRESDLDLIPAETLALWKNTGQGTGANGSASDPSQQKRNLWWYFALALLVTSVLESLFASRYLAPEKQPAARRQAA